MARVRPVRGRMGVRSRPRRIPLQGGDGGVHHLPTSGMPPPPARGTPAFNWWRYDLVLRGRSDADVDAEIAEMEEWLADPPADEVGIGIEENVEERLARAQAEKDRREAEAGAEGVAEFSALPSADRAMLTHAATNPYEVWHYGNYGNPIGRFGRGDLPSAVSPEEYRDFLEKARDTAVEAGHEMPEGESRELYKWLAGGKEHGFPLEGDEGHWRIGEDGAVVPAEKPTEEDFAKWPSPEPYREPEPEYKPYEGGGGDLMSEVLSTEAKRLFQGQGGSVPASSMAPTMLAASGEPPRLGRAHPERPSGSPPYEPLPELSPEQIERNKEGVRKARKNLGSSPVGGQHSMEQTFAPAIEQRGQSLGLSTTDQMLLMAALAAVTGGGSAALRAAPLVGRGALASVAGLGALIGGASPAHAASGPTVRELSPEQAAQLQKAGSVVDQAAGAGGGDRGWRGMAADAAMAVPFTRGPASAGVALRNLLPPAGRVVRDAGITAAMLSPAIAELTGHPIPSFGNNVLNSPDQKALIRLAADRAAGRGRTRGQR